MSIFNDFRSLLSSKEGQITTTTFNVAKAFNKRHSDVIRALEKLDCSKLFAKRNFALCYENNDLQNGKPQKFYKMTESG